MKKAVIVALAVLILSLVAFLLAGCSSPVTSELKVVSSTSLLEYIVRQVGGDKVDVVNLVPPINHPGNYDVKPGDIQTLANARLFILHGWPGEGYADKLIASADNPNLTVIKASVNGNWMIPSVQMAATGKVAEILGEADSENAAAYQNSAAEYKQRIQAKEADIKAKLAEANVSQVNVISSARQADFLTWAGLNVVAQFNTTDMTDKPQVVQELVDTGRQAGVTLIVNNLQDGKDAGKALAEELGAENLNLSNFPGGFDDTETWEKAIDRNIELILGAVAQ
ncbi:MAG: zinc ABC transporter substrate-binding protein [Chloroflexi bacterium]|nr:zinc ABC transporter substrate-binding protein [Chloroflexota bacterium]